MARQIAWVIALLAVMPSVGRAADLGVSCDRDLLAQQRAGHPPVQPGQPVQAKPGETPQDHPPQPLWWIDPKLRVELGINDQQSAAVDKVWQKSSPSLIEGRKKLRTLEDALSQMTAIGAEESAVIAQIEKVENLRAELNKGRTLMIYRMNKLLSADQRAKVKEMYERRDSSKRGPSSSK